MPIDIEAAGNKVDKASTFFDKVNAFMKRHPWWFAFIVLFGLGYWAYNAEIDDHDYDHPSHDTEIATPVTAPIEAPVEIATPVYIEAVPETIKIPATPVIQQLQTQHEEIEHEVEEYIIDQYSTVDSYGDSLWIGLWSDGVIDTVYYWELDAE